MIFRASAVFLCVAVTGAQAMRTAQVQLRFQF